MPSPEIKNIIKEVTPEQVESVVKAWEVNNINTVYKKLHQDKNNHTPSEVIVLRTVLDKDRGWCVVFTDTTRLTAFTQYKPFESFLLEFRKCEQTGVKKEVKNPLLM